MCRPATHPSNRELLNDSLRVCVSVKKNLVGVQGSRTAQSKKGQAAESGLC